MMRYFIYAGWRFKMVSLLILLSMSMFHVCCSNDNKMMNEVLISSFTVWSGEQKIDAVIDNEQQKIMISGIEDGNQITNIEYALTSGVTFYPEPHTFLNNWKKEMNLVARTTDNQKVYTIVLKDYENVCFQTQFFWEERISMQHNLIVACKRCNHQKHQRNHHNQ